MNKNKVIAVLVILNILLVGICISSNTNIVLNNEKQIIKEMTAGEYESKLTELNKSHEDYALQVQTNKQKIATAISNQKVATSEEATIDEIVENIGKILQVGTSDATATSEDIIKGKTAYVNGEVITGTVDFSENESFTPVVTSYSQDGGFGDGVVTWNFSCTEAGTYIAILCYSETASLSSYSCSSGTKIYGATLGNSYTIMCVAKMDANSTLSVQAQCNHNGVVKKLNRYLVRVS